MTVRESVRNKILCKRNLKKSYVKTRPINGASRCLGNGPHLPRSDAQPPTFWLIFSGPLWEKREKIHDVAHDASVLRLCSGTRGSSATASFLKSQVCRPIPFLPRSVDVHTTRYQHKIGRTITRWLPASLSLRQFAPNLPPRRRLFRRRWLCTRPGVSDKAWGAEKRVNATERSLAVCLFFFLFFCMCLFCHLRAEKTRNLFDFIKRGKTQPPQLCLRMQLWPSHTRLHV
jgi:hypothetical protein